MSHAPREVDAGAEITATECPEAFSVTALWLDFVGCFLALMNPCRHRITVAKSQIEGR